MNDFVFAANWYDIIKAYDDAGQPDIANTIAREIINYCTTGCIKTTDPLICGIVKCMCAQKPNKVGRPKKYDAEDMLSLHNQGMSDKDIAEKLGCAVRTVQRAIAKHGGDNDEI